MEQRFGGWNVNSEWKHRQYHEFMACDFILEKYVTRVTPIDGLIVRKEKPDKPIRSDLDHDYIFDWELQRWRFDQISPNRKRAEDEEVDDIPSEKRQRVMNGDMGSDADIIEVLDDKPARNSSCKTCKHKTDKEDFAQNVDDLLPYLDLASPFKNDKKAFTG